MLSSTNWKAAGSARSAWMYAQFAPWTVPSEARTVIMTAQE